MNSEPSEGAGMIEVMTWLEVNKKRLAVGAAVLIVVGFGIYVVNHLSKQKEIDASDALIKLRPPMNAPTNQPPIASSEYIKVAESFKGTTAAERAVILAAGALFTEGKYAEAQTQFQKLLTENANSPWAAEASFGVAASIESQGKQDEALTAYQRVVTAYANESVAGSARMAIARIQEAKNNPEEALKQYEELAKPSAGGMTMQSQEAMMARGRLLKKHPNLVKAPTNMPPAMTMSPGAPIVLGSNAAPATAIAVSNAPASAGTNLPAKAP